MIRFGKDSELECMRQDEVVYRIAHEVSDFAVIYLCDKTEVPDFNTMYELYDPMTVMSSSETSTWWLISVSV